MSFLNAALLAGVSALAIPLVIHLLNRSRFRTVSWGAMHLLDDLVTNNSRRIRWQQWLLLLVRCAIPALLAFCLARPVLTQWQALPGDAPTSTVVLLDNSYSMDVAADTGTCFSSAVADARAIVQSIAKGSDCSVILTGGQPTSLLPSPVFEARPLIDRLNDCPQGRGAGSLNASLELAGSVIAGMAHARRNVVVISDFQKTDVDALNEQHIDALRQQFSRQAVAPQLTLIQPQGNRLGNVAIESVELSATTLGVGQALQARVRVKNYGDREINQARLRWKVDEQVVGINEIGISAGATSQALLVHRFEQSGSHGLSVEIDVADHLKSDNRFVSVVDVIDSIEVLLVDGKPSDRPMRSETDFLAVALTPFSMGSMKLADLVQTRVVRKNELPAADLQWARVIVLANVARLSDDDSQSLAQWVRQGGGLLLFAGDQWNLDWYNHVLHEQLGLLPLPVLSLDRNPSLAQDEDAAAHIVAEYFDHPALEIFNTGASELTQADIRQWIVLDRSHSPSNPLPTSQLKPVSHSSARSDGRESNPGLGEMRVLMRLDSGDPLLVEHNVGQGHVMVFATSADDQGSNLPLRPVYLPLVQQLVTSLATRGATANNLRVGQTLTLACGADAAELSQVMTLPSGKQLSLRPTAHDDRYAIQYQATEQPGIYTLSQAGRSPQRFAVETDRRESDLRVIDSNQLERLAQQLGGQVAPNAEAFLAAESLRRHGREVWRWALAAVGMLLFGELVLQQRIARGQA